MQKQWWWPRSYQCIYKERALEGLKHNIYDTPDSMVHGANMGPIWGRQDPGRPHVGPMNFAIWELHNGGICPHCVLIEMYDARLFAEDSAASI